MAVIDLTNFDSSTLGLVQSSAGRTEGTPNTAVDGNVFFDVANGRIELITFEESPVIDMSSRGGSATEANPLTQQDGVKLEALYAFEREQRRSDETLRQYDFFFKGTFKFGGAYELVNGRKFDDTNGGTFSLTVDDRFKIRGSGWIERDTAGAIGRIYYGNVSLGNIESGSAPYYQLSDGGAPTVYDKVGPINEAVQVFGNTGIDANSPINSDLTTYEALSIRTYGQNFDRKILSDSGVTKMDGYSSGFALSEGVHLTTNETDMPIASVFGPLADPQSTALDAANQVGVWLNMDLEELDSAQLETGFNEADGNFTWVLNNPNGASLNECLAFLDACAQTDADINAHVGNTTNGQRVGTWYSYNAAGKVLPQSGTGDGNGLFIEGLTGTDKTSVIFSDDASGTKTYPNYLTVTVNVGAGALSDANAWFHAFFETGLNAQVGNDFGTATAITVEDPTNTEIKGDVDGTGFSSGNNISFQFDYNGDTDGGNSNQNKDIVFECEGDGGVTAAKTVFTLTDPDGASASVSASCVPPAETNV